MSEQIFWSTFGNIIARLLELLYGQGVKGVRDGLVFHKTLLLSSFESLFNSPYGD